MYDSLVAPLAGARIEIGRQPEETYRTGVAPLAGAIVMYFLLIKINRKQILEELLLHNSQMIKESHGYRLEDRNRKSGAVP